MNSTISIRLIISLLILNFLCSNCHQTSPGLKDLPTSEKEIIHYLMENKSRLDPIEGIYFVRSKAITNPMDSLHTDWQYFDYRYIFKYNTENNEDIFLCVTINTRINSFRTLFTLIPSNKYK